MNIKQVRDKIRGLSNPEGINQYTKGGGSGKTDEEIHKDAMKNYGRAPYATPNRAQQEASVRQQAKHWGADADKLVAHWKKNPNLTGRELDEVAKSLVKK